MKKKVLWIEITLDEYELPVAVADTSSELSRMRGYSRHKVAQDVIRWKNGKMPKCKYRKVEVDDDE